MKVIVFYFGPWDTKLLECRRFTEEEKSKYADWYREKGLVGVGESVTLKHVGYTDSPDRESCGSFPATSNICFEVTDEEWAAYVAINKKRAMEKERKEKEKQIQELECSLKQALSQKLYMNEEASAARRNWVNVYNEGGAGYVPHFWTLNEVEEIKKRLKELRGED